MHDRRSLPDRHRRDHHGRSRYRRELDRRGPCLRARGHDHTAQLGRHRHARQGRAHGQQLGGQPPQRVALPPQRAALRTRCAPRLGWPRI